VAKGESFVVVKRSNTRDRKVADWTCQFVGRHRLAFEALADK
jgi:hypothetical protein